MNRALLSASKPIPPLVLTLLGVAVVSFLAGFITMFTSLAVWVSLVLFLVTGACVGVAYLLKRSATPRAIPGTDVPAPQLEEVPRVPEETPAAAEPVSPVSATPMTERAHLSVDDWRFIKRNHAWLQFRSKFQQYFTGVGVVSAGVIATVLLLIFAASPAVVLSVLGATLVLGVVTFLPRLRDKLVYNPSEERLPKKVQAELAVRHAQEADRLAAEDAENRVREKFWDRLNLAFAIIAAYWRIPGFRMNVYAVNMKGTAGKSLLMLYLGTLAKFIVSTIVGTLIPVTRDRKSSTAGRHAGVNFDEDPLRHSQFTEYRKAGKLNTPEAYASLVATTPGGLYILVEDPNDDKEPEHQLPDAEEAQEVNPYPATTFKDDLELGIYHSGLVLLDGANNDNVPGSIPDYASRYATVIMPVGNYAAVINLEGMQTSIRSSLKRRAPKALQPGVSPRDGQHIATADKVRDDAVCVITNVPDGVVPDFNQYTDGVGSANVVIRHDKYMHNEGSGEVNRVDINKIDLATILQIAELLVELCRVSAKTLGLDDSHIAHIVPDTNYRYHPQMQRVDEYGRIVVHDTTPTTFVPAPPQRPVRPQVNDVSPEPTPAPQGTTAAEAPVAAPKSSAGPDLHKQSAPAPRTEPAPTAQQPVRETDTSAAEGEDPYDQYAAFQPRISVGSGH